MTDSRPRRHVGWANGRPVTGGAGHLLVLEYLSARCFYAERIRQWKRPEQCGDTSQERGRQTIFIVDRQ